MRSCCWEFGLGGLDFVLRGVILSRFPLRERWWGGGVVRGEGDWDSVVHVRWRDRGMRRDYFCSVVWHKLGA